MSNLLVAEHVSKHYGAFTALDDVSLAIPAGSIFGLLGPNGAGKTTLIRIINQIIYPNSGRIVLDGKALAATDIRHIGYLPEERGLYNSMKVGEQALYLARLKGMSKTDAKSQLKFWFERLGMEGWWNKKIQELSKGMAQKVQFVVTVLHRPKLLIFDEPFSGFDPVNADIIKEEILYLRQQGATVVFSTHRMESVEELCDHMALIHRSRKLVDGKVTDIKKAHKANVYEVGLEAADHNQLEREIMEKFSASQANFASIHADLKLRIELGDEDPNDLLLFLTSRARVNHFVEVVPSVKDIFIKNVTDHA